MRRVWYAQHGQQAVRVLVRAPPAQGVPLRRQPVAKLATPRWTSIEVNVNYMSQLQFALLRTEVPIWRVIKFRIFIAGTKRKICNASAADQA